MKNFVQFRGPDHIGIKQINEITLGHLRLSVLDLNERSNQPMVYDNLYITYNGEIYNFLDLKTELTELGYTFETASDTEVLLIGYKAWGPAVVSKLNGMFAFCIYDPAEKKIFGARDRLGVKPFYYYWKDGRFEICSQLRPLSKNKELSEEAISIFLDCGYIPTPYSIFKNVFKLTPGNCIEIDLNKGDLTVTEYWNLREVKTRDLSYEDAKAEFHELLKDSVKIRLQSDVPVGTFLSGGIDSALVSAIASNLTEEPINTFTVGFEQTEYDESIVAREYANILGSNHKEIVCNAEDVMNLIPQLVKVFDEPFADSSALPSLLLNSVTTQFVTVALSGDGGDESFFGYDHFEWIVKSKKMFLIPGAVRRIFSSALIGQSARIQSIKGMLRSKNTLDFIWGIFAGYITLLKEPCLSWRSSYASINKLSDDPLQKTADFDIKFWLENDGNVKVDRASMAYSVEVRSPFLDYRIIEFARSLPIKYRYHRGKRKKLLRDILKEYIPEEVFNRPKKGFSVPMSRWIRNELRQEITVNLSDEFLNIIPNLDVPKFKRMLQLHLDGKANYALYIWRLYILAKWYQEFIFSAEPYADAIQQTTNLT